MKLFETHSIEPGYSINPETGEQKEIEGVISSVKGAVGNFVYSSYTQLSTDLARLVTSNLGEEILCNILGGKKAKRKNNKGFDIILPNGLKLEAKTGRIRNVTVIKNTQLEIMDKDYLFGFVFYRTTDNKAPSHFTSQSNGLSPSTYLKRNISVESIFIFPYQSIVYYYNTCGLSERNIGDTGIKYRPLGHTNALKIFSENYGKFQAYETEKQYGKHNIKLYSLGYEIK